MGDQFTVEEDRQISAYNEIFADRVSELGLSVVPEFVSSSSHVRRSLRFYNYTSDHVDLFWINYEGRAIRYSHLQPRTYFEVTTYVSHPWIAFNPSTADLLLFSLSPAVAGRHPIFVPILDQRPAPQRQQAQQASLRGIPVFILSPVLSLTSLCIRVIAARLSHSIPEVYALPLTADCKADVEAYIRRRANYIASLASGDLNMAGPPAKKRARMPNTTNVKTEDLTTTLTRILTGRADKVQMKLSKVVGAPDAILSTLVGLAENSTVSRVLLALPATRFFVAAQTALLGADGAVSVLQKIEERIKACEIKERTGCLSILLCAFLGDSTVVLQYERLRTTVKEKLPRLIHRLWGIGDRDSSAMIGRVLFYCLLAEREYKEGTERSAAQEYWTSHVMKEDALKKDILFSLLSLLIQDSTVSTIVKEGKRKSFSKVEVTKMVFKINQVDIDAIENDSVAGEEGRTTYRYTLADTIACHFGRLRTCTASRPLSFSLLIGLLVRVYAERQELPSLMKKLLHSRDVDASVIRLVVGHSLIATLAVMSKCKDECESGHQLLGLVEELLTEKTEIKPEPEDEDEDSIESTGSSDKGAVFTALKNYSSISLKAKKHRRSCGCASPVASSLRAVSLLPVNMMEETTRDILEASTVVVLCSFEPDNDEPLLGGGAELLKKLLEEGVGRREIMKKEENGEGSREEEERWPDCLLHLCRAIRMHQTTKAKEGTIENAELTKLARLLLLRPKNGRIPSETALFFLDVGCVVARVDMAASVKNVKEKAAREERLKDAAVIIACCRGIIVEGREDVDEVERMLCVVSANISDLTLPLPSGGGRSLVFLVLRSLTGLTRAQREHLLARAEAKPSKEYKKALGGIVSACRELIRQVGPSTPVPSRIDPGLATVATQFLLNVLPYLPIENKLSASDLSTWPDLLQYNESTCESLLDRLGAAQISDLIRGLPEAVSTVLASEASPSKPRPLRIARLALRDRIKEQLEVAELVRVMARVLEGGVEEEEWKEDFVEMATKAMQIYADSAGRILTLALAVCAANPVENEKAEGDERVNEEEREQRRRWSLFARLDFLHTAIKNCRAPLDGDQVALFLTVFTSVLLAVTRSKDGETTDWKDEATVTVYRLRFLCSRVAAAIADDDHFSKVLPFALGECVLPLCESSSETARYPLLLLSNSVDKFGRSLLATCLPPAERLAYSRLFPTFKDANKKVV